MGRSSGITNSYKSGKEETHTLLITLNKTKLWKYEYSTVTSNCFPSISFRASPIKTLKIKKEDRMIFLPSLFEALELLKLLTFRKLWRIVVYVCQCDGDGGRSRQAAHVSSHVFSLDDHQVLLSHLPIHPLESNFYGGCRWRQVQTHEYISKQDCAEAHTIFHCWRIWIVVSMVTQRSGHDWASPCAEITCVCIKALFLCSHLNSDWVWVLCCLSCIILNIVCRMDVIDSATALHIKRAQHRHIGIIHSGNRGLRDHQMNIKPLIKAGLWHDTLPLSWAASDNKRMLDYDE